MTSLLAWHGFTGSPRSWDCLRDLPSPRFIPALVGHAGAEAPSIADFEAEVARLAALLHGDAAHVIGYSLGARLALGIALRHPERVRRLTLLSGHAGLSSETDRSARRASDAAWIELLQKRGLQEFVQAWEALPLWATQARLAPELLAAKRRERLSHRAQGLAQSLRCTGLAEMPDYWHELSAPRQPVPLLAGAHDTKFSTLARHMAERIPHAELVIVPDAGHDLLLECPDLVNELVRKGNQ